MIGIDNSPFAQFTDKINKDLLGWTLRKQTYQQLLKNYQNTLLFLQTESNASPNVLVDIGEGENIYSEARRINSSIILRMRQDLYIQLKPKEAEPIVKDLICLYREKIGVAQQQIKKIMVSMREVQQLIHKYSSLA